MVAAWQARAEAGDREALDRLLSRPMLSAQAEPYWQAFSYLERDRDEFSHSLGMAGGLLLVKRIKRPVIRGEGRRLGYRSADLDDFVEIVAAFDDERVMLVNRKSAADVQASMKRPNRGKR